MAWVGLAQVLAIAGQFVLVKAMTGLLSASDFGRYALVMAVAALVHSMLFGPLSQAALRFFQEARERLGLRPYFRAVAGIGAAVAGTVGGVAALALLAPKPPWTATLALGPELVGIGLVIGLLAGLIAVGVNITNAALLRGTAGLLIVLGPWAQIGAVTAAHWTGVRELGGLLAALALAYATVWLAQCLVLVRVGRVGWRAGAAPDTLGTAALARRMVRYSWPLVFWALPAYVTSFGDRWALARFTDTTTVGIYAVMALLTFNVMTALGNVMNRVLAPVVYATSGAASDPARAAEGHRIVSLSKWVVAGAGGLGTLVYLLWPEGCIRLVSPLEYTVHAAHLWALMAAASLSALSQQEAQHGMIEMRPNAYLWVKVATGLVALPVLAGAGAWGGLPGVVYGLLLIHGGHLALLVRVNRRIHR